MADVVYVRIHETTLKIQMSGNRIQEFGENPGGSDKAKREDLAVMDNEVRFRISESKPKVPPTGWMYRNMQIGILEIQRHHPHKPCGYPAQQG